MNATVRRAGDTLKYRIRVVRVVDVVRFFLMVVALVLVAGCTGPAPEAGFPIVIRAVEAGTGQPAIGGFAGFSHTYESLEQLENAVGRPQVEFDPGCNPNEPAGSALYPDCSAWRRLDEYRTPRLAETNSHILYPLDAESHQVRLRMPEEGWIFLNMAGSCSAIGQEGWFVVKDVTIRSGEAELLDDATNKVHVWGPANLEIEWACF